MKDYYDLWAISNIQMIESAALDGAIQATFERRATDIPKEVPIGLSDAFIGEKKCSNGAPTSPRSTLLSKPSGRTWARRVSDWRMRNHTPKRQHVDGADNRLKNCEEYSI